MGNEAYEVSLLIKTNQVFEPKKVLILTKQNQVRHASLPALPEKDQWLSSGTG